MHARDGCMDIEHGGDDDERVVIVRFLACGADGFDGDDDGGVAGDGAAGDGDGDGDGTGGGDGDRASSAIADAT